MGVDRLRHAVGGDDLLDLVEHRRSVIPGRRVDFQAGAQSKLVTIDVMNR